jgi:glycosyltransferase involved in cell wall biosynthesis
VPPKYSIVIPALNEALPLKRLLKSLNASRFQDFETIVVSDTSSDDTDAVVLSTNARLLRNERTSGPAASRNRGAAAANAPFLIFLDADVVPTAEALETIDAHLSRDAEMRCFVGVYASEPATDGWFQRYRACLSYSYVSSLPMRTHSTLFVSAIAGIERDLFLELGGFDETDHAKHAEDTELGYRIRRQTAIHLLRDVQARHEFPSFYTTLGNYFHRSAAWIAVSRGVQSFDNHTTTPTTAILRIMGAITALLSVIALPVPRLWLFALTLNAIYFVANKKLFLLLLRNVRARDLPRTYVADLLLGISVLAGAVKGVAQQILRYSSRQGLRPSV